MNHDSPESLHEEPLAAFNGSLAEEMLQPLFEEAHTEIASLLNLHALYALLKYETTLDKREIDRRYIVVALLSLAFFLEVLYEAFNIYFSIDIAENDAWTHYVFTLMILGLVIGNLREMSALKSSKKNNQHEITQYYRKLGVELPSSEILTHYNAYITAFFKQIVLQGQLLKKDEQAAIMLFFGLNPIDAKAVMSQLNEQLDEFFDDDNSADESDY